MFSGVVDVMLSGLYCKQTCAKAARKFDAVMQGVPAAKVLFCSTTLHAPSNQKLRLSLENDILLSFSTLEATSDISF